MRRNAVKLAENDKLGVERLAKDPICGMTVDEKTAKLKSEHEGKTFYFCSAGCKTTFDSISSHGPDTNSQSARELDC